MNKSPVTENTLFSYVLLLSIFIGAYTIAPLLAVKIVQLGPLQLPAGDFIYALTFIATDITNEVFGKRYAKRIVFCGLITLILVYVFTQLAVLLPGADFWDGEDTFNSFFATGFRIFLATLCAYVISQFSDIFIFSKVRAKTGEKFLWLRNNISTFVARFLDAVTFVLIAFYGVYENAELISIIVSAYTAGIIISILDTPIVYAGVFYLRHRYPELKTGDKE